MDFNTNKGFIIGLAVGAVLIIVFFVLWRGASSTTQDLRVDTRRAQEQYQRLVSTYDGEPTQELVESVREQINLLMQVNRQMRAAATDAPLPSYTPSTYKNEIRAARDTYRSIAGPGRRNIRIPDDIGLAEYLGPKVPERRDLERLTREFVVIRTVMDLLLSNNVEEVSVIDRHPAGVGPRTPTVGFLDEDIMFDDDPTPRETPDTPEDLTQDIYSDVSVAFRFRMRPKDFYRFLAELRNADYFLRVRSIRTNLEVLSTGAAEDPRDIYEMLTVDTVIDHIKLNPGGAE